MILDGKVCAAATTERLREQVNEWLAAGKRAPHLGVIQVGTDGASTTYVNAKHRACEKIGIRSTVLRLPEEITEEELLSHIEKWNQDKEMDGFIVQLPLPRHISTQKVIDAIAQDKDVDGFQGRFTPATPLGVMTLLEYYQIPLAGKECVILGRSDIVGRPLAKLLSSKGSDCTVTLCHSRTKDVAFHTRRADIIIAALGVPEYLKEDMVKEGAVIVDVGITRVPAETEKGYRLAGDVDYEHVASKCAAITPVPGGVGPMTICSLMMNTLTAYQKHIQ